MDTGHAGQHAEGHRLGETLCHRTPERAAADLDHDVVETCLACQRGGDLVAEGLATFDREAVLVALAGKGKRAFGDRRLQAVIGRVAGHAFYAGTNGDLGSERLQPVDHGGLGVGRDEHEEAPAAGGGDDGGRQGGVAAAGDRERRRAALGHAEAVDDLQMDKEAEQVAGLVRAGDVACLVLHPDRTCPEAAREGRGSLEGRHDEPVPVDLGHLVVEVAHEAHVRVVGHAVSCGEVIGVEQVPPADERVRLGVAEGELEFAHVELAAQDVVTTVAGAGAAERVRLGGVDDGAATATHHRAEQLA